MPVTAQRLLALMNGEDVSLARIAELVEFDQAIAAQPRLQQRDAQTTPVRA